MDFEVNDSSLKKEQIEGFVDEVKRLLPSGFAEKLMYGKVELKKAFSKNASADYNWLDDLIRLNESCDFVKIMIHELGHRWHHKFCTKQQEKALLELYKQCKKCTQNKPIKDLKIGDTIEYMMSSDEIYTYVIVGKEENKYGTVCYKCYDANDKDKTIKKMYDYSMLPAAIRSINGKRFLHYKLPSEYAGKNFYEFVAECFEQVFGYKGAYIGKNLGKAFLRIIYNKF